MISCLWCLLVFDYEDMVLMTGGLVVSSSNRQNRRTFLVISLIYVAKSISSVFSWAIPLSGRLFTIHCNPLTNVQSWIVSDRLASGGA